MRSMTWRSDDSRSGEPSRPRKYFWATMFVAFCDHDFGNSTPRCSKAGAAGSPMTASRISHSTALNGCVPASVNCRGTETPAPRAVIAALSVLGVSDIFSPRIGLLGGGDTAPRVGRIENILQGELIHTRHGLVAQLADHLGELVEVGDPAVDRGELDRGDRVEPGQPALGQVADPRGRYLRP